MRLQSLVEVVRAPAGNDDRDDEENDRDDREDGERLASGRVFESAFFFGGVHADEFEDEVGEGHEVDELFANRCQSRSFRSGRR